MRISFNLISCNLGNNGGSQTIIESANTLYDLGHDVTIVDSDKNYNTWNPIKCKHVIIKNLKDFPSGDIVIATGIKTVDSTNKISNNCGKKYHWIRGYETWTVPEEKYIKILKESKCRKIVNSICLQRKLNQFGIKSKIIRPGHDFDKIYPLGIRNDKKVIIGGLYNEGKKRSKKRTEWIFEAYKKLKKKYDLELWMFGSEGEPKIQIDKYFKNPDMETKNNFYNKIDIWLVTSLLEGLHIPPAEAMLTECCVIGTNSELSGTEDYLIHNETGLVTENDFNSFLEAIEILINNKILRDHYGYHARKMVLSLGDRKENMTRLVNFLK